MKEMLFYDRFDKKLYPNDTLLDLFVPTFFLLNE